MHAAVGEKREEIIALCRRYGVTRLDLFGSGARGMDFGPLKSDVGLLVEFGPRTNDLDRFLDFKEALEALLARPVDLVDRKAVAASRNYIRKSHILASALAIYAG